MNDLTSISLDCQIGTSRIIAFPIELAYRAWADPQHLSKWWGPAGFTNTFHQFDFRVGGRWSFVMHGPDKGNYVNECEFTQIEPPYLLSWKRHSKPLFNVLVTFESMSIGETKIIFRQIFETAEECDKLKKYVVDKNEENFDRLEAELKVMEDLSKA